MLLRAALRASRVKQCDFLLPGGNRCRQRVDVTFDTRTDRPIRDDRCYYHAKVEAELLDEYLDRRRRRTA